MRCDQVRRELVAYMYGSLSAQERAELEEHLSTCEACSGEANELNDIGDLLSRGLKEWTKQGICPPDVAERIELSVRSLRRPPWWRRWPVVAGAVAAAACLVFVVVVARQPLLAQHMASVPILGALAAHLAAPDVVLQVDPKKPVTGTLFRPVRTVDLSAEAESGGVRLLVERVSSDLKLLRVQYSIHGEGLKLPAQTSDLTPQLVAGAGELGFQGLIADRRGDTIQFIVYFEAVPAGERLTLTVPPLVTETGEEKGPWVLEFTN